MKRILLMTALLFFAVSAVEAQSNDRQAKREAKKEAKAQAKAQRDAQRNAEKCRLERSRATRDEWTDSTVSVE